MSKKDFSVALKYVEARPRSQRRKGAEARVSSISVGGSGVSATDLSLLNTNLISVTNNFTALKDLFDSMFEKDSDNNIHAKLSLWSSGGITAGGVGSGGSGGGGISYNRLDSWSDYSADKAGYVLSAALGKDLDDRVSTLANAGYITASYLAPYALRSEIPSLVGYATQSWVGENYLSKNGGTVNGETVLQHSNSLILTIKRTGSGASLIRYNGDEGLRGGIGFGTDGVARIWDNTLSGNYPILTSDNFSQYALPLTGGVMAKNSYINWGNTDGFEDYSAYSNGFKILGYNAGSGDYRGGIHVGVRYGWQLTRNAGSEVFQIRNYSPSSASWGDWKTIAYISDIPTKLSDLTDDVVVGKYLPLSGGTVNGDLKVSGVATLGSLVRLIETDGSTLYKVIQRNSGGNILLGSDYTRDLYIDFDKVRVRSNGTIFSREVTAPTFIGNLTGNADSATYILTKLTSGDAFYPDKYKAYIQWVSEDTAVMKFTDGDYQFRANSATKLATPRTIWGQSFDGTGDITGPLHLGNNISIRCYSISGSKISTLILDPSNTLLLGYDMSNIGGTVLYGKALAMRYGTSRTMGFLLNEYGNVAIGGATADEKLHVHGNGKFTGALTAPAITTNTLKVGNVTLVEENGALKVIGGLVATGGVTSGEKAS